ncbi:MAG: hypothetical protein IKH76_03160, partial [Clostridiales bacterium]|nr:hypothetical protein [Clostridiales bacterium]
MKYKKVVATVLSLAMAVSTLPMSVLAEETEGSTEESSEVVETVDEEVDAEEGEGNDGEASDTTPAEESSAGDVSDIPDEPNDTNGDEQEINVSSGKVKTYNAGEADTMSWNDFKAGVDNTLSGETYTLQADVIKTSGSGSFSIDNKFIEIDLNGHTIDASQDDNDMFYINGDGLVTIKNGTLIGSTK